VGLGKKRFDAAEESGKDISRGIKRKNPVGRREQEIREKKWSMLVEKLQKEKEPEIGRQFCRDFRGGLSSWRPRAGEK